MYIFYKKGKNLALSLSLNLDYSNSIIILILFLLSDQVKSYKLLVVDVEPEFADEDEVKPDSSCWWRFNFVWRLRRTIRTIARSKREMMASVRVPISAKID